MRPLSLGNASALLRGGVLPAVGGTELAMGPGNPRNATTLVQATVAPECLVGLPPYLSIGPVSCAGYSSGHYGQSGEDWAAGFTGLSRIPTEQAYPGLHLSQTLQATGIKQP